MMLTEQEKTALAARLRSTTVVETNLAADMLARLDRVDRQERFIETRVGPTRTVFVRPATADAACPLFINIHGGGFVRGYQLRDTAFCAYLAETLGCLVIDIDYRLAPEHPFPTALHECYDVVGWAFRNAEAIGVDAGRIALGGHSAGGNLTAAVCLMANRTGQFRVCQQVLDYPFLDAVTDPADKIREPSIFKPERLRAFNDCYLPVVDDRRDPLASPVLASADMLAGLPPATVLIAGRDPLRHEADTYVEMLAKAGVEVRLRRFLDSDHGFVASGHAQFREGLDMIRRSLAEAFTAAR